ncbi:hypothetical protein, partial [Pseudomonas syringae group genomosp. 3]|uniref:hypothetical protein n=1 Tax=Pseudomonas syringae group genomosp. 3 TaxID=251701 RepID=UPI001E61C751
KNGTHLAALPLHSGNALPLFWHCRLCAVCNPRNHWLLKHGTPIALSVTTESGQPAKVSRHEHQLR